VTYEVCRWILLGHEEHLPAPPGTSLVGLEFTQGDGFRDGVMRFSGPLVSVQHALASLSYQVCSRMLTYAHLCVC
jgi:hypothetical protein